MGTLTESSEITYNQKIQLANDVINDWSQANVFLGIGVETPYSNGDAQLPIPNQSTDYINNVYRNLIALKKITAADMTYVVPRVDWQTGVTYAAWDDAVDMYSFYSYAQLPGTVTSFNTRTLRGTNTAFVSEIISGDQIFLPGDEINVASQLLLVTDVFDNVTLNVATTFSGNVIGNNIYLVTNTAPDYVNTFYARNIYDQVFICLYNNANTPSNTMPQISLGGSLPESAYIVTPDGYKWKYLYTIPAGQKQLFLTPEWMPVYSDPVAVASAVNGRLDIILINNSGTGYNQNVISNSATILTVQGDGTGANLTAVTNASGSITNINILNPGQNYTVATITAAPGVTGVGANLRAVIGPLGGHGFDPVHELGATNLMIAVELIGSESNTIPTGVSTGAGLFEYRQLSIIEAPLATSGNVASNLNYSTVSKVGVQSLPSGSFFSLDETVYQGVTLANATFSATVVYWDNVNNFLWLNNLTGTFTQNAPIVGTIQTKPVTAFILTSPDIQLFTGKILYINNTLPITRGLSQTELCRVVLSF